VALPKAPARNKKWEGEDEEDEQVGHGVSRCPGYQPRRGSPLADVIGRLGRIRGREAEGRCPCIGPCAYPQEEVGGEAGRERALGCELAWLGFFRL
jgi:hypothetical protein